MSSYTKGSTVVLHGLEIETDQIGEKKVILRRVPCPIAHEHGIRVVGAGSGRGEYVCHIGATSSSHAATLGWSELRNLAIVNDV